MLGRLPDLLANKVASYCALAFGDASDEVEACISAAARACPDGLRVKELLETFEAYREIAAFAHTAGKVRPLDTIYDMACGHGMLGALLAYRFPKRQVVCVDTERRPIFDAFVNAFREFGHAAEGEDAPMSNLSFEEGDALKVPLSPACMVAAVHACNDLARHIIEAARAATAAWAVLPCCIRAGTYLPCRAAGTLLDDDDAKHVLYCGVVAGMFEAEAIHAIDKRITNRNIIICGGLRLQSYAASKFMQSCGRSSESPSSERNCLTPVRPGDEVVHVSKDGVVS